MARERTGPRVGSSNPTALTRLPQGGARKAPKALHYV